MTLKELLAEATGPILFSAPMIQKIHDDDKFATRRLPQVPKWALGGRENFEIDESGDLLTVCENTGCLSKIQPRYKVGNTYYCVEAWRIIVHDDFTKHMIVKFKDGVIVDADFESDERYNKFRKYAFKSGWQSPRFMPKEVARLFVKITGSRPEELQDITEEQAINEGVGDLFMDYIAYSGDPICNGVYDPENPDIARLQYRLLWDSLHRKQGNGWDTNPYVYAYDFERVRSD